MAREVDTSETDIISDSGSIVDAVSKGEYVLILGSDIMLDTALNEEASGDSTKFFLKKVLRNNPTLDSDKGKPSSESFQELILNNSLNPTAARKWLLEAIAKTEFDTEDLTSDLLKLLKAKFFRLVMTTTFDPSVEKLMDEVWGKGGYRIMNIYNPKDKNFDLQISEFLGEEYFDIPPTLYYVFGKADPKNKGQHFVLDDNDTMDCISRWLGKETSPSKLLSYIDTKKILVLGCNLKDWCFRFFWYAMRHKKNLSNGDIAVLLQTEQSEQDENLYRYLTEAINVNVQTDSRKYIKQLAEELDENVQAQKALQNSQTGGVFISYASEDFAIALNVFSRLRNAGLNVWLDNKKLGVSAEYDKRIANAIKQCNVFMPILSSVVAGDLSSGKSRYYMKEWEQATGVNSLKRYFPIVTSGYDYKADYHQKLPENLLKVSVFDWEKEPFDNLIARIYNQK